MDKGEYLTDINCSIVSIKEPIWTRKGTYMGWIKVPNYINIIYI